MKLSTRTHYALKALSHLARRHEETEYVLIAEIAATQKIPKKFLEHVLLDLKKADIVDSKKGKYGGYRLMSHPREISLGNAVRAVEGHLTPLPLWIYKNDKAGYSGLAGVFLKVREAVRQILDNTTLEALVDQNSAGGSASSKRTKRKVV